MGASPPNPHWGTEGGPPDPLRSLVRKARIEPGVRGVWLHAGFAGVRNN